MRQVLAGMLSCLGIERVNKTTISTVWEDNNAALTLANTPMPKLAPKSKTFAIKYHWFRTMVEQGEVEVKKCSYEEQKADIMTKALRRVQFKDMRKKIMGW